MPAKVQPSPLTVGDIVAAAKSARSFIETVSTIDPSATEAGAGSKVKTGAVRSMIVKSETAPIAGPQLPLKSETEFAPSCKATDPSLQPVTVTTCIDDCMNDESIAQPLAEPKIEKSLASRFVTVAFVIK